jgi:membrane associated rhomboid family serine protease
LIPLRDYQPSGTFPILTIAIILINALVFGYQFWLGEQISAENPRQWVREWRDAGCEVSPQFASQLAQFRLTEEDVFTFQYGAMPCKIIQQQDLPPHIPLAIWFTLFTSMFMHGGLMHILGNMWYLWIFGDNVESKLGKFNFLIFYLFSGLIAAFAQILTNPNSVVPMVGASGAISGVLGAYLVLYPYGRVLTLIPLPFFLTRLIELPAIVLLGFWFVLQFFGGLSSTVGGGGVAYWAHAGGFVAGAAIALLVRIAEHRRSAY